MSFCLAMLVSGARPARGARPRAVPRTRCAAAVPAAARRRPAPVCPQAGGVHARCRCPSARRPSAAGRGGEHRERPGHGVRAELGPDEPAQRRGAAPHREREPWVRRIARRRRRPRHRRASRRARRRPPGRRGGGGPSATRSRPRTSATTRRRPAPSRRRSPSSRRRRRPPRRCRRAAAASVRVAPRKASRASSFPSSTCTSTPQRARSAASRASRLSRGADRGRGHHAHRLRRPAARAAASCSSTTAAISAIFASGMCAVRAQIAPDAREGAPLQHLPHPGRSGLGDEHPGGVRPDVDARAQHGVPRKVAMMGPSDR